MIQTIVNILEQTEGLGKEELSKIKTYLFNIIHINKLNKGVKDESRTNNTRKRVQCTNKCHKH